MDLNWILFEDLFDKDYYEEMRPAFKVKIPTKINKIPINMPNDLYFMQYCDSMYKVISLIKSIITVKKLKN